MNIDVEYLNQALSLAKMAEADDEVPVGAVIVQGGQVVGKGHNRREKASDPCAHAEIEAIQEAARTLKNWRLVGCQLYVTLEPCLMCLGAMQLARISRVVYGTADPKGGALSLGYPIHTDRRLNHRFLVEHLPLSECAEILSRFFKKKRSKV